VINLFTKNNYGTTQRFPGSIYRNVTTLLSARSVSGFEENCG